MDTMSDTRYKTEQPVGETHKIVGDRDAAAKAIRSKARDGSYSRADDPFSSRKGDFRGSEVYTSYYVID
jgi:hypothetical protein